MINKMKHIKFVHHHNLSTPDFTYLMKEIYNYLIEICELENTTKVVIDIVIIPHTDETYAKVHTLTNDGAEFEDYFLL